MGAFPRHILIAIAAAASLGGGALADPAASLAPALPPPHVVAPDIVHPDWLKKPSGDDVQWAYPIRALRNGISGSARISCLVAITGEATDCVVLSEDPPDQGFGAAALKLSSRFTFRPQMVDGAPVGGAKVVIPLRFVIPGKS